MPRWVGLIVVATLLTACSGTGGPLSRGDGPYAPSAPGNPDDAVDGMTVGHRLMKAGEYELALKAYYRGAAEQGLDAEALTSIGNANLGLGRLGQAETILRRAIDMNETYVPAWNNLGVVLIERGEYGEAERVFRTAYALDSGNNSRIRENLRLALAKLENPAYDSEKDTTFALVGQDGDEGRDLATP